MFKGALVSSGSFKTSEDVNGKYIECTAVNSQFSFPQSNAYGTWEFSFVGTTSLSQGIGLMNTLPVLGHFSAPWGNGYAFHKRFDGTGRVSFLIFGGGSYGELFVSSNNLMVINTWYDIKITRTLAGVWTVYIKSAEDNRYPTWTLIPVSGGSNPVTNNTYKTSNFAVVDMDTGDKLKNYRHYAGVIV